MTLAARPRKGHAERAWHALRTDPWTLVALAALAFLAVFVVLPLFELLRQSVIGQESGRFGLENFVTFFESRYFRRALGNSFLVATLGTVLALMIGLPLAFVFARYDFPAKRWIEVAILMSMLSPPFVGAYAWILMFGRSGLVTEAGRSIGLELPTIYGPVGIAIASAFGLYPLVEIAWADGTVDEKEREAFLRAAAEHGLAVDTPGHDALRAFIKETPRADARKAWFAWAEAVNQKLTPLERRKVREGLVKRARAVAEASGGFLGLTNPVSDNEARVITRIEETFAD